MIIEDLPDTIYYYKCKVCKTVGSVPELIVHNYIVHDSTYIPTTDLIIATYKRET